MNRKALFTIVLIAVLASLLTACGPEKGVSATYINMSSVASARVYTYCGMLEQTRILRDADAAAGSWNGTMQEWLNMESVTYPCILTESDAAVVVAGN